MILGLYWQSYLLTIYLYGKNVWHKNSISGSEMCFGRMQASCILPTGLPPPNSTRTENTFPKAYPLSGRLLNRTKVAGRAIRLRSSTVIIQINASIKRTAPRQRSGHRRGRGLPGSRRCQQRGWVSSAHRRWQVQSPLWRCHRAWPGIPR